MTQTTDLQQSEAMEKTRMECLNATLDFERKLAKDKNAPELDRLPQLRSRAKFETITAILLALGVSGMSLVGNFLVFNKVLHWTF